MIHYITFRDFRRYKIYRKFKSLFEKWSPNAQETLAQSLKEKARTAQFNGDRIQLERIAGALESLQDQRGIQYNNIVPVKLNNKPSTEQY